MDNKFDSAMSRINFRYVRKPNVVTENDVSRFERELGYALPGDYRAFLLKYGLATGHGDLRVRGEYDSEEDATSVDVFYGLNADGSYDLRDRQQTFAERLPAYLLPFVSGSGGEFCLCLAGENTGKVYWWFQESGEVKSEDELELIACSFEQFVNSLINVEH